MYQWQRVQKLCELLNITTDKRIDSRAKFCKLIYILQGCGEDFDEDFEYDGRILSRGLIGDLGYAEEQHYIEQKETEINGIKRVLVELHAMPVGEKISLHRKKTGKIVKILEQEEPDTLEVLSLRWYLRNNHYKESELDRKLKELEPELQSHYQRAFELDEKLRPYALK